MTSQLAHPDVAYGYHSAKLDLYALVDTLRANRAAVLTVLLGGEHVGIDGLDIASIVYAAGADIPPPVTIRVSDQHTVVLCARAIGAAVLPNFAAGAVGHIRVVIQCVTTAGSGDVSTGEYAAPTMTPGPWRVAVVTSDHDAIRPAERGLR